MRESFNFKDKSFAVYGLGITGDSVVNFLSKNGAYKIHAWDDYLIKSNLYLKNRFITGLNTVDYIVMSPGINILKSKFKKTLLKNKKKIITDLDLFFLKNKVQKSIVITGTNGKSTTCSLIHHILKKNRIKNKLVGNIGKPVLDEEFKKKEIYIIEASSFQLEYSKFIKPYCAAILNLSQDHLDWHGSFKNYLDSKFNIFSNQNNKDIALLNNKFLIKKFFIEKYKSKLKTVNLKKYLKIKDKIKNNYLKTSVDDENMSFVYAISKIFYLREQDLINSLKSFKGLNHRQELFYKKKNLVFINDSKATSFDSAKFSLRKRKNIFWIVGGLPKKGDKINLSSLKKNIVKSYIIGKHMKFFQQQLKGKIKLQLCRSLKKAFFKLLHS